MAGEVVNWTFYLASTFVVYWQFSSPKSATAPSANPLAASITDTQKMTLTTKTIFPIILTAIYAVGLLLAGQWSKKLGFVISDNKYISGQFNYQIVLLFIVALSILTTYLLNKQNFTTYFSFGKISTVGQELKLFGIKQGDTWTKTGLSLCVVISLVTATFLYFQLKQINPNWTSLQSGIFWIVLFSLTNSFGEEMIFRLGVVSPLSGQLAPTTIFLISAVLFGIPQDRQQYQIAKLSMLLV